MQQFPKFKLCSTVAFLRKVFMNKKYIPEELSPIDRFFGTIDESDSNKMLTAVQDCRRIEPYEW